MRTEARLARGCAVLSLVTAFAGTSSADSACPAVPGFAYATFSDTTLAIGGGATTDSFDSGLGTYLTTRSTTTGHVGTSSTAAGGVALTGLGTKVNGRVDVGVGGVPGTVISAALGTSYASSATLASAMTLAPVTIPTVGSAQGNKSATLGALLTLAPGQTYGTVQASTVSTIALSPGTYVMDSLQLSGGSTLLATGPVVVYVRNTLDLSGGTVVNASLKPANLVFFGASTLATATITGGATAAYAVYAPSAAIATAGLGDFYGSLVGRSIKNTAGVHLHHDRALASYRGGPFACLLEVSRASPVIASIANQTAVVQGTYEFPVGAQTTVTALGDVATFTFPFIKGHMRARAATSIATTASSFSGPGVLFDAGAAGKIPPVNTAGCATFNGTCRNVFTTTAKPAANGTALRPARVQLKDSNADLIGALIVPANVVPGIGSSQWTTVLRRVLAGVPTTAGGYTAALGGVDRSTVAVIPPSTLAGTATRPTIAYFGATDGMLHAVCASVGGVTESGANICPSLGTELWAFLPRTQLPLVRRNLTRIDGSVRVVDAFGAFGSDPATGSRSFRTILTFQTGFVDATIEGSTPAVYSLDITDPANPIVLWEYTAPAVPGEFELGVGLTIASSPALVGGKVTNLVVAQGRNGGIGAAGVVATGLDLETGTKLWGFGFAYPTPPRGNVLDLPLPVIGIPGGAVAVDPGRTGLATDIVFGDLYGDLWLLDAATGTSRTGTGVPLFRFSTNKHPIGAAPAIYSNGNQQFAVFGSGSYADPIAASWSAGTQSLISVKLTSAGPFPLTETSPQLGFKQDLGAGQVALAQATVVGTQVFLSTEAQDVNSLTYGTGASTGRVVSLGVASGATTTVVVRGGAGSVVATGTTLYSSSSDQQQQLAAGAASTTGERVDQSAVPELSRRLWLRTE